tara:strand:+ start:60 stop:455 length:396 start_codon:yes stop_codon:yes gene_type:complete
MIGIKIVKNDSTEVAKIVLIDQKQRALFLKRSNYVKKYAGEWDLPGGHLKEDENIIQGLKRETKEETQLEIREPIFLMKLDNLNFFYERYNSQPVKISHEHTDYKFFSIKELDKSEKFQRIAIKAIEESIK